MNFAIKHVVAALTLWMCAVPSVADEPVANEQQAQPPSRQFELLVTGPDGKPVPNVKVDFRLSGTLKADHVPVGKLVKSAKGSAQISTDDNGLIKIQYTTLGDYFMLQIMQPGFGPYAAWWNAPDHAEEIPAHLTAELEGAWSMGGTLVDADGKPVEGAKIQPWIEFKKQPDDHRQMGSGASTKTDAQGRWHFDFIPNSLSQVQTEITHPAFKEILRDLSKVEFEIQRGAEPTAKIAMDRGLTVTGKVTDENGNPIDGAQVRAMFRNDRREAETDSDGVYLLGGCEATTANLVVSAKGKAYDMQEVQIGAGMGPVDFQMKPGGTIRVRVLDENGNAIPKTRIFFQKWRGPSQAYWAFENVNQYADKNGLWQWDEAPQDAFQADVCPPGGLQLTERTLQARDEEYVFQKIPELTIAGTAVDADTKQPIKDFRVVEGIRFQPAQQIVWQDRTGFAAHDGKFQLKQNREYAAFVVRVEADGYLLAVSRDVKSDEGKALIELELKKGKDIGAIVTMPDGKPATGAKIALGGKDSFIRLRNGDIEDLQTSAAARAADAQGRFHFPPQPGGFLLVVTHPNGFASLQSADGTLPETIPLSSWATVEGVYKIGSQPAAGVPIEVYSDGLQQLGGEGVGRVYAEHRTSTDKDGHFVLQRVAPGKGNVGREMTRMVTGANEVTSSCQIHSEFVSGTTTHVEIGGNGRPVVATIVPPKDVKGQVQWQFAEVSLMLDVPNVPPPVARPIPPGIANDPAQRAAWFAQWQQTDDGKIYMAWALAMQSSQEARDKAPQFSAFVDRDGKFRIDDVPTGDYSLSVRFFNNGPGNGPGTVVGYHVQVPEMDGGRSDEALDLGTIRLK